VSERLTAVRLHAGNSTRDRPEVSLAFIAVYAKFRRNGASAPLERRLCGAQQAFYWVRYGQAMWRRGRRGRGALAFARAFYRQPNHPELWSVVSGKLLRLLRPARVRPTSSDNDRRDTT